jgi:hypothetical protein
MGISGRIRHVITKHGKKRAFSLKVRVNPPLIFGKKAWLRGCHDERNLTTPIGGL